MPTPAPFWTVPAAQCPQCLGRETFLFADSLGPPEPGDLLVCCLCGILCVVTHALQLREFLPADLDYYDPDTIALIYQQIADYKNQKGN